jgi:signal transduction histidine kinase
VLDSVLAVGLCTAALVEVLGGGTDTGWAGPLGVQVALAVLTSLPLIVRRRAPLAAAAVIGAATAATVALAGSAQGPFEPFVALVVSVYSVGALVATRVSCAVLAAFVIGLVVPGLAGLDGGPSNTVPAAVWVAAAWVVGRVMRSRTARTRELEDVTAQLAQEREERASAAVAVERTRIARELHDVVAHNVSVMVLHAQAAARSPSADDEVRDAMDTIAGVGRQTVDELRRLLGILRTDEPTPLSPPPSLRHVDALVEGVRAAGLDVTLAVDGTRTPLPTGLDVAAYRIVQEALTNSLKHAGGHRTRIVLRYSSDAIDLEVLDDGPSGPVRQNGGGHGLVGMRERVALYGGRLETGPRASGGFAVRARLPLTGATP